MPFHNEYIPPIENETSEFLKAAREKLRAGFSYKDSWTVDRDNDMVLYRSGGGHSLEARNDDYWDFMDHKGHYLFTTTLKSKADVLTKEMIVIRIISFQRTPGFSYPDAETFNCIKKALQEYKDAGVWSKLESCQLVLVDAISGEEL